MTGRRTGSRAAFGLSVAPVSALMLACTVADEGGATADQWIAAPAAPEAASRSPSVPPSTAGAAIDGQDPIDGRAIHSVLPDVDLSNRIVPLTELMSGGAGAYSGVPSIHDPEFVSAEEATRWIRPREPVLVTFCPLCYTAIAFEQGVDGEMRDFGVSGLPRASDLALYEYQTTTLWQQLTDDAIVGTGAGKRLRFLPGQLVAFEDARAQYPDALVLSRETGFNCDCGANPYAGYEDIDSGTIFKPSFDDGRLPAKAQVGS